MSNYKSIFMIIISSLLIISLFLNLRSCGGGKSDDKYSKLESENLKLQRFRDSLLTENSNLRNVFQVMQEDIDKRHDSIVGILSDLKKTQRDLKDQKEKTSQLEKEKRDIQKKIDDLLKNPIKRDDDDLVKSLKNKLKP